MKYFFALAYLLVGLVIATRVRNVSGRFAVAYPNLPEHAARERVACWFQLVLFLLLVISSVRLAAPFAAGSGEKNQDTAGAIAGAAEPAIRTEAELAKERLDFHFRFELDQLGKESHTKH